jgi:pimeloyl-ACP methyl ester carboxylesterase
MLYMTVIENVSTKDIKSNPQGNRHPGEANMLYEEVYIQTSDNLKLFGWFVKQAIPFDCPTLIYFQENAGNIGMRIPFMNKLYQKLKVNILIVGYRGYGYSEGIPSEEGLMLDGEAILKYVFSELKEKIDTKNVFILGRSLGGAVGVYCASHFPKYDIKGIIIENTFTSIGDIVDQLFSYIKYVRKYMQKNFWPTDERIGKVTQPMMFIISEKDELVPMQQMEKLFNAAVNSRFKRKYIIQGATHNDGWLFGKQEYINQIKSFIEDCDKAMKESSFIDEENVNLMKNESL